MMPKLLTLDEAAIVARRTPKAMRQLRAQGRGPRVRKIEGRVFIEEGDLVAWLGGTATNELESAS